MISYAIVLAIALLWSFAAGSGAFRDTPAGVSRRTAALRDAARKQFAPRALETFRDPRRSPVIFMSQHWHQRWWCEKLGVTSDVLRAAIREVGPMTADVERHLAPRHAERPLKSNVTSLDFKTVRRTSSAARPAVKPNKGSFSRLFPALPEAAVS